MKKRRSSGLNQPRAQRSPVSELGEACAIGETIPVAGIPTLKDSAIKTEAVEHLASEGPYVDDGPGSAHDDRWEHLAQADWSPLGLEMERDSLIRTRT